MVQQSKKSSKRIDRQSIPSRLLPPDIIVEILLRFPVETLLRCKSVCTSWYTLISSRYFINSHVRLIFSLSRIRVYDLPRKLVSVVPVNLIGSCNGLLCIVQWDNSFLYNPSTRIYKRLPYSGLSAGAGYSFGYDESSDDYKVVGLSCDNKVAKIYSLKTGRWKDMNDVPYISPLCHSGTFSNGAFHWMVLEMVRKERVPFFRVTNIVSFDLATETFGEVSPPRLYGDKYDRGILFTKLTTLGEWLCVIVHYGGSRAHLWVMKVYGVKDSWTKLVSIPYYNKEGFYVPVSMSNDGTATPERIMRSFTQIQEFDEAFEACTHVDSLVSPHSPLDSEQIEELSSYFTINRRNCYDLLVCTSRYGPGYRDSDYGVDVGGHHHIEEPGFKGTTRVGFDVILTICGGRLFSDPHGSDGCFTGPWFRINYPGMMVDCGVSCDGHSGCTWSRVVLEVVSSSGGCGVRHSRDSSVE
ncbi:F-box associated interaction domain-containing protein [Artemisia annua]|uniref:F-box associated interaction domain-containing protein n=1 Tax=Artemisia annua TaxID=35608 RepID=A0A2U1QLW4_ARTAN|nr:F-box associated interaction domain-containing protein [Artemisia annua]